MTRSKKPARRTAPPKFWLNDVYVVHCGHPADENMVVFDTLARAQIYAEACARHYGHPRFVAACLVTNATAWKVDTKGFGHAG